MTKISHKLPRHIAEVFERFPPDWQMRKRFNPNSFGDVLEAHNKPLVKAYHAFMRGITEDIELKAKIAVNDNGPLGWTIRKHRGGLPAGVSDWQGMPLGAFEDNWERHFTRCAFEYADAVNDNVLVCHQITQRIESVERSYHRLVYPIGGHVLIASQLLYLRAEPGTYDKCPMAASNG